MPIEKKQVFLFEWIAFEWEKTEDAINHLVTAFKKMNKSESKVIGRTLLMIKIRQKLTA